jgi:hypothetical protein
MNDVLNYGLQSAKFVYDKLPNMTFPTSDALLTVSNSTIGVGTVLKIGIPVAVALFVCGAGVGVLYMKFCGPVLFDFDANELSKLMRDQNPNFKDDDNLQLSDDVNSSSDAQEHTAEEYYEEPSTESNG